MDTWRELVVSAHAAAGLIETTFVFITVTLLASLALVSAPVAESATR